VRTRLGATLFILMGSVVATAQVPSTSAQEFEIASVKRNVSGSTRSTIQVPAAGTITFVNVALRILIRSAYDLHPDGFTLISGPFAKLIGNAPGMRAEDVVRFDVQAKPPANSQPQERRAMLRALLEDRFKLRAHKEMRPMQAYAITVARPGRLGPNLKPSKFDCEAYFAQRRAGGAAPEPVDSTGNSWCELGAKSTGPVEIRRAGPLKRLAELVGAYLPDHPVVDATGLPGNFEWVVTFSRRASPQADYPEIFTAFQEQLGLKIESRLAPIEVLVVDHVELPTPN
jgi:uncharacterized protein (TIGR03435 family)